MLFLSYRLLLLLPFIMDQANCVLECLDHVPLYRFYRVRSCHRSKSRIIGARNVLNLTECANFAKQRNALAFNFSPTAGAGADKNRQVSYAASCQILGCPEIGNMSTLVSDIDFDYYSAFANLNGKCLHLKRLQRNILRISQIAFALMSHVINAFCGLMCRVL